MAVERKIDFILDLEDVIKARLKNFDSSRKRIQLSKEMEFQSRVISEALSYEDQMSYRKNQIEEEKIKTYPDADFLSELKGELGTLKKLNRFEKLRKEYLDSYTELKQGKISSDSFIDLLGRRLSEETDSEMRAEISENISNAKIEKHKADVNALKNKITLAEKDDSISVIEKVLSEVNVKRNEALSVGDEEMVSFLDIKIQTLNSQKVKLNTEQKFHDFDFKVMKDGATAMEKLDLLRGAIADADTTSVINIDGQNWASEQEFWTHQREAYISGSGSGEFKDFLLEFSKEVKDKTLRTSAMSDFGYVPLSMIAAIDQDYKNLAQKSEFASYLNNIENYRIGSLVDAIDKTAKAIMADAEYSGDYDKGFAGLKSLQEKFGINTAAYVSDLYYRQISTIPAKDVALRTTAEVLAEQRGTTPEEEYEKLITPPIEPEVLEQVVEVPPLEEKKAQLEKEVAEKKEQIRKEGAVPVTEKVEEPVEPVTPVEPKPEPKIHIVKAGETLSGISQQYLQDWSRWKELKTEKGEIFTEETARKLQIGTKLIIPQ